MDFASTIKSKSDQLNSVDLIEDKIIKITAVNVSSNDQPVSIFYEGDEGKPYKPCLSMRRVIGTAWGLDESKFIGRSLQLYNDMSVIWAGEAVGGVRIKAMSHIDSKGLDVTIALNKKKRTKLHIDLLEVKETYYPDEKFKASWEKIKGAIIKGMSYDDLVAQCEKTGKLSNEQQMKIHATYQELKEQD